MFRLDVPGAIQVAWPAAGLLLVSVRVGGPFSTDVRYRVYDVAGRRVRHEFTLPTDTWAATGHFRVSPGGRWLSDRVGVYDLGPVLAAVAAGYGRPPEPAQVPAGPVLAFSPDGRAGVRPDFTRREAVALRLPSGREAWRLWFGGFRCLCAAADAAVAVAIGETREVRVVRRADGGELCRVAHPLPVSRMAFSPDGRLLATAAGRTVRLWDARTGERVRQFKAFRRNVQTLAFHPSGRFLAVGDPDDDSVRFWDVGTGRELARYEWGVKRVADLLFSPDGLTAAAVPLDYPGRAVIWDVDV